MTKTKKIIFYVLALPVFALVFPMILVAHADPLNDDELHYLLMASAIGAELIWITAVIGFAMWLTL